MADPNSPARRPGYAPALELVSIMAVITFLAVGLDVLALLPWALVTVGAVWCIVRGGGGPRRPILIPVRASDHRS